MTAIDDTIAEKQNWHWRNTMRPARFFNLDARAAIPFGILLMHARLWVLIFAVATTILFYMLERRGLTFPAAMRTFRRAFMTTNRPSWNSHRYRRMKDFGAR